ncbi:MAG: A24 family peptidase [Bryobacteraceae bacterium]
MPSLLPLPKILVLALVLVAGVCDFRSRRIPNWLTVTGVLLGFAANALIAQLAGLGIAALGLVLAMAVYLPLYLLRAMGAGDVKLMAAVGALVGPSSWLGIFLAAAIAGGIIAVCVAAIKGRLGQTLFNVQIILAELLHFRAPYRTAPALDVHHEDSLRIPHGVSIALGTCVFLFVIGRS